jgi:hypothetical protein
VSAPAPFVVVTIHRTQESPRLVDAEAKVTLFDLGEAYEQSATVLRVAISLSQKRAGDGSSDPPARGRANAVE